jgi:hypothetical protein
VLHSPHFASLVRGVRDRSTGLDSAYRRIEDSPKGTKKLLQPGNKTRKAWKWILSVGDTLFNERPESFCRDAELLPKSAKNFVGLTKRLAKASCDECLFLGQ